MNGKRGFAVNGSEPQDSGGREEIDFESRLRGITCGFVFDSTISSYCKHMVPVSGIRTPSHGVYYASEIINSQSDRAMPCE